MKKPRYVYCVISHVDTEPSDNVRRNGLMGLHSSRKGAEEHLMSMINDRRKMPEYEQLDVYMAGPMEYNRHLDESFREYYCLETLQYRIQYKFGDAIHRETIKVEKRFVSTRK